MPDNYLVVSNSNGMIHHIFETDPVVINAMIEAGAGTEFSVIGSNGEIEALYLGTFYGEGVDMEFIPNPQIPIDLLDFDFTIRQNQLPPMFWPLLILALLAMPFILYALLKRTCTVSFYGEQDENPYKQKYKKHDRLSPPDVFEREGEVIAGWYTDKLLTPTRKWSFTNDKVSKNHKLYARWVNIR